MYKRKNQVEGLCVYCGKNEPINSKQYCESCQSKWLTTQKEKRKLNKKQGTCIYCSNQAIIHLKWCTVCKEKKKERDNRDKLTVFENYGGAVCKCCGENEFLFLTIDHINGDGNEHRKEVGTDIYSWLIKENFPSGFQVLCYNCNCGRQRNGGICPHHSSVKN